MQALPGDGYSATSMEWARAHLLGDLISMGEPWTDAGDMERYNVVTRVRPSVASPAALDNATGSIIYITELARRGGGGIIRFQREEMQGQPRTIRATRYLYHNDVVYVVGTLADRFANTYPTAR